MYAEVCIPVGIPCSSLYVILTYTIKYYDLSQLHGFILFLLAFLWIIHHDVPIHCMVVHVLNRAPHQIL